MGKRFLTVGLVLFCWLFVNWICISLSHAADNEELESRIKDLEDVVLGHKRHPLHPLTEINITGGLTGIIQGSADVLVPEADKELTDLSKEAVTQASGSMDLVIEFPIANHHLATVFLEAGAGDGLQPAIEEAINEGIAEMMIKRLGEGTVEELEPGLGLLHGINDDAIGFGEAGESDVHLLEAWFEGSYFNELLTVTLGKIDLTNYMDANEVANDETAQFLSSGFVNNLAIDFPEKNGPGLRLTISPVELVDIDLGIADAGGEWDNVFDDGFGMLEVHIKPKFGELEGNYRFYGWMSDKDHVNFVKLEHYEEKEVDNPESKAKEDFGTGYGISADQELPGGLTVFGRLGTADDEIYPVKAAWSAGAQLNGGLWGRDDDVIAFAYGEAIINKDHPDWQGLKELDLDVDNEQQLEVYYSLAINENVAISPHAQYIMNPAGIAELDNMWVFGTRAQINFF
jgi:high affinity Mn2+ porin